MSKRFDNLRAASFRGVPFFIESSDIKAGRRVQKHEYPKRDKPFVEDMGRATRGVPITAFIVGDDYVAQANKLLAAFEEPGAGTLVHPELGSMTVSLDGEASISFRMSVGHATVSASFIETGELEFPVSGNSTPAKSRLAAQNIEKISVANFAKSFSVAGFQDFVPAAALGSLSSLSGLVSGNLPGLDMLGYANRAAGFLQAAPGLLKNPLSLGSSIAGMLGISSIVSVGMNLFSVVGGLLRLVKSDSLASPLISAVPLPSVSPSRRQIQQNEAAVNDLSRQVILAQAVGVSSLMPAVVTDDALLIRDDLLAALDAESSIAVFTNYHALRAAATAVYSDITARAKDGERLTTITPPDVVPALVVAYDLYEDAGRAGEIVTRNKVRHPGFVAPRPLRVLSR